MSSSRNQPCGAREPISRAAIDAEPSAAVESSSLSIALKALEDIAYTKPERVADGFVQGPAVLWPWAKRHARTALLDIAALSQPETPDEQ